MAPLGKIEVELSVVVGSVQMPLHRLLALSRGAVIRLGGDASAPLAIHANGHAIAEGRVQLDGEKVTVAVTGIGGA